MIEYYRDATERLYVRDTESDRLFFLVPSPEGGELCEVSPERLQAICCPENFLSVMGLTTEVVAEAIIDWQEQEPTSNVEHGTIGWILKGPQDES